MSHGSIPFCEVRGRSFGNKPRPWASYSFFSDGTRSVIRPSRGATSSWTRTTQVDGAGGRAAQLADDPLDQLAGQAVVDLLVAGLEVQAGLAAVDKDLQARTKSTLMACLLPLPNWPIVPSTPQSRVVLTPRG